MTRPHGSRSPSALLPPGARVAVVVSTYHRELTGAMARSAAQTLVEAGLDPNDLVEVEVPGAFELPLVARRLARRRDVAGVLCFGLVLKGETEHDRYIARAVSEALMRIGLEADKPVSFGVLTCATLEQARERARPREEGGKDKGREAAGALVDALAALEKAERAFRPASGTGVRDRGGRAPGGRAS